MINRLPLESDDDLLVLDDGDFEQVADSVRLISRSIHRSSGLYPNFVDVGPINFLLVGLHGGLCYQSLYKVRFKTAVGFVTIPVGSDQ